MHNSKNEFIMKEILKSRKRERNDYEGANSKASKFGKGGGKENGGTFDGAKKFRLACDG